MPTDTPTAAPTTLCPNTTVTMAIDSSWSIDDDEMEIQERMLKGLVKRITFGQEASKLNMLTFNKDVQEVENGIDNDSDAIKAYRKFARSDIERGRQTDYRKMFEYFENVNPGNILVLVTDGKPWIKNIKRDQKRSIQAAKKFKKANPETVIYCFNPDNSKQVTPFLNNACDFVFSSTGDANNDLNEATFFGKKAGDNICMRNVETKKTDPCSEVMTKPECTSIRGNIKNGKVVHPDVSKHKVCHWKRGVCHVTKRFKMFYN